MEAALAMDMRAAEVPAMAIARQDFIFGGDLGGWIDSSALAVYGDVR